MIRKSQSGQVGLVVLLITVVMLTVGVSVASRSVSDLKLTRQEQESTRALDIAESGIEDVLSQDLSGITSLETGNGFVNGTEYNYSINPNNTLTTHVDIGHTAEIKLSENSNDQHVTDLNITFTNPTTCPGGAALELAVFTESSNVSRYTYDPCGTGRGLDENAFTNLTFDAVMARVKVLYASADLTVTGTNLPVQSYTIRSTTTVNGATRAVEVTKPLAALPSIFDYVLFSGDDLVK